MLTIRKAQIAALESSRWDDFVLRADSYARQKFPERLAALGRGSFLKEVEHALVSARQHGFESEYDLLRYVDLTFSLGSDFDRSSKYSWFDEILTSAVYSPRTKMDLLAQLAMPVLGMPQTPSSPLEYDEPDDPVSEAELPDEEILPLDDDPADFEPESEEPEELPEDIIEIDEEYGDQEQELAESA